MAVALHVFPCDVNRELDSLIDGCCQKITSTCQEKQRNLVPRVSLINLQGKVLRTRLKTTCASNRSPEQFNRTIWKDHQRIDYYYNYDYDYQCQT